MREFGRQALSGWAGRRHAEVQPARTPGLRQVGERLWWLTTLGTIAFEEQLWRCGSHPQRPFAPRRT